MHCRQQSRDFCHWPISKKVGKPNYRLGSRQNWWLDHNQYLGWFGRKMMNSHALIKALFFSNRLAKTDWAKNGRRHMPFVIVKMGRFGGFWLAKIRGSRRCKKVSSLSRKCLSWNYWEQTSKTSILAFVRKCQLKAEKHFTAPADTQYDRLGLRVIDESVLHVQCTQRG